MYVVEYKGRVSKVEADIGISKQLYNPIIYQLDFPILQFAIGGYSPDTLLEANDGSDGLPQGISYLTSVYYAISARNTMTIVKQHDPANDLKLVKTLRKSNPNFFFKGRFGEHILYLALWNVSLGFERNLNKDSSQLKVLTLKAKDVRIMNSSPAERRDF